MTKTEFSDMMSVIPDLKNLFYNVQNKIKTYNEQKLFLEIIKHCNLKEELYT